MRHALMLIAVAAAMILFLGWAGEAMGDWAGSDPGRIKTVLIVETAVLIGLLVHVIRIWRRRRGNLLGE